MSTANIDAARPALPAWGTRHEAPAIPRVQHELKLPSNHCLHLEEAGAERWYAGLAVGGYFDAESLDAAKPLAVQSVIGRLQGALADLQIYREHLAPDPTEAGDGHHVPMVGATGTLRLSSRALDRLVRYAMYFGVLEAAIRAAGPDKVDCIFVKSETHTDLCREYQQAFLMLAGECLEIAGKASVPKTEGALELLGIAARAFADVDCRLDAADEQDTAANLALCQEHAAASSRLFAAARLFAGKPAAQEVAAE